MNKLVITAILLSLTFSCKDTRGSRGVRAEFNFKGTANGGTLIIGSAMGRNSRFSSVETYKGESVEGVIEKIAKDIAYNQNLFEKPVNWTPEQLAQRFVRDGKFSLAGAPGNYYITGTETGLGIPEPPKFLSCRFDKDEEKIIVKWVNPRDNYDNLILTAHWDGYGSSRSEYISGEGNYCILDRQKTPYDVNNLDIWIIGFKDGLPSAPGCITLSDNGTAQQELGGIPLKNGVIPNWEAWDANDVSYKNYESHVKSEFVPAYRKYHNIKKNSDKPFGQVLKTPEGGGTTGVYRKFLDLIPGHTYRISCRLNTFQMNPNQRGWSFSLHAVPDRQGIEKLTEKQMAGLASLPDGRKGPEAGRIVNFGPGITTKGQYEMHSADIQLPQDSNSITVWLRHTGKGTSGVGLDWIKLEDISSK